MKRTYKIIGLYIIGILCLGLFNYIHNSQKLNDFLEKADRVRIDWGFGLFAIVGLLKMILLILGMTIPLILTFMILREKFKKKAL